MSGRRCAAGAATPGESAPRLRGSAEAQIGISSAPIDRSAIVAAAADAPGAEGVADLGLCQDYQDKAHRIQSSDPSKTFGDSYPVGLRTSPVDQHRIRSRILRCARGQGLLQRHRVHAKALRDEHQSQKVGGRRTVRGDKQ